MKTFIITPSAIILAAAGIAWLISIGGWFFLTILVVSITLLGQSLVVESLARHAYSAVAMPLRGPRTC